LIDLIENKERYRDKEMNKNRREIKNCILMEINLDENS